MLREMPEFQLVMDDAGKHRPIVPTYRPAGSLEESNAVIEEIKFQSGRQEGFDFLFKYLTGK